MTRTAPRSATEERGAGLFATSFGLLVFLLLMFAAVQVLFNLYATSLVTSAGYDAAREVAGFRASDDRCAAVRDAEAAFVEQLGGYGDGGYARLEWRCTDPDTVTVRIIAQHPTILPTRLGGLVGLSEMDRTISVRVEDDR
ncbi:MAG: hypothetical protein DHS20C19_21580 [Acidimicrobiales bacterium]|nr:MAG: hypothetical protein DHS20C19_21580 [Acidimicrobiales bacterium]